MKGPPTDTPEQLWSFVERYLGGRHPEELSTRVVPTRPGARPPGGWAEDLFASWGDELGRHTTVRGSLFGFYRDRVQVASTGGHVVALHSITPVPGDGVDSWHFVVRDERMGGFVLEAGSGHSHVRVWGDLPALDALVAQWA